MEIMTASQQWAVRPDDERFLSLEALRDSVARRKDESSTTVAPTTSVRVAGDGDALSITLGDSPPLEPTNYAFGQLAYFAGAPASYIAKLPGPLAAHNLQWGLDHDLRTERRELMALTRQNGSDEVRAFTSPRYGRIWDLEVVEAVESINEDGFWQVPAATYSATDPLRATTLYASDRDCFLFLVDPEHPVEVAGDELYRGFIVSNSEVGAATFSLSTFLYRTVCDNRIIWGATEVDALSIRHTSGAPERFINEARPILDRFAREATAGVVAGIRAAMDFELAKDEREDGGWEAWLRRRGFGRREAVEAIGYAELEEGGAGSLWDIVNGLTARAREVTHTNTRVALEERAGALMAYAAR